MAPQDTVEHAYLAALGKAATYTATATALTIYDASGAEILAYVAATPGTITGHTWHLRAYNNGKQAVVSVIDGTDPTAVFGTDGQVTGNATCNSYFGPYTITGAALKIGPLGSTLMACPTTAQQDQETQFLTALQAATTFNVQGLTLELRDNSGALMAQFVGARGGAHARRRPPSRPPSRRRSRRPSPRPLRRSRPARPAVTPPPTSTTGGPEGGSPTGLLLVVLGASRRDRAHRGPPEPPRPVAIRRGGPRAPVTASRRSARRRTADGPRPRAGRDAGRPGPSVSVARLGDTAPMEIGVYTFGELAPDPVDRADRARSGACAISSRRSSSRTRWASTSSASASTTGPTSP